jgi:SOS response regulatory protein OraA/RecX
MFNSCLKMRLKDFTDEIGLRFKGKEGHKETKQRKVEIMRIYNQTKSPTVSGAQMKSLGGTGRWARRAFAVMAIPCLLGGHPAMAQVEEPWRPYQPPQQRDRIQQQQHREGMDPIIHRQLWEAGLTRGEIQYLQQRNFQQQEVVRVVRQALQDQGWRPEQALQQAEQVARQIQRHAPADLHSPRQAERADRMAPDRERLPPGFDRDAGDIRTQLRLAGLTDRQIQRLRQEGFRYRDVEREVTHALQRRDFEPGEIQRIARQVAEEVHATASLHRPELRAAPRPELGRVDAPRHTEHQVKMRLHQAGLSEREIQRLERKGFEYEEVQQEVMDSLREKGWTRQQAAQEAAQIASLAEPLTAEVGDRDPLPYVDRPWGAEPRDYDPEEVIKHVLYQAGVAREEIRELERQNFPREEVKQAVRKALRENLEEFAEQVAEKVERVRERE